MIIPLKLPSLNEYISCCRANKYAAASLKKETEEDISYFINQMPVYTKPIIVHFTWHDNTRRDYDNIAFAKKFILDAMQKCGKIPNDNRKYVKGFTDNFKGGECSVEIEVEEL